ncbi:MAG: hypothetical protein IKO09_01755 [Bacteroidales bacterium]|nr:hypothetical protein [Bacteroidales bacterium]
MKKHLHIWITIVMAAVALTSCENYPEGVPSFYSSEYRIVGAWQVSHTYLNGVEIDSTDYVAYSPTTFYYMYADHVMSLTGIHNGELRQSSFATYILDPKAKTIDFNFSFFGKRYVFTANIMRLSRKEFFIEFDDEYGDHWRLELFSRSSY